MKRRDLIKLIGGSMVSFAAGGTGIEKAAGISKAPFVVAKKYTINVSQPYQAIWGHDFNGATQVYVSWKNAEGEKCFVADLLDDDKAEAWIEDDRYLVMSNGGRELRRDLHSFS